MDAVRHVGLDLAWGRRNRTGAAVVDDRGALVTSATLQSDDDIVHWIEQHAPTLGVVAIDAPLIVANREGSRPCERQIHAAFGRFDAGAYPSNTTNPNFAPPRARTLADRLALSIDPTLPSREGVAIEVYPHPAMIGLFRLGRTVKYKRKQQGFALQQTETKRLLELMGSVRELRLADSPRWSRIVDVVDAATGPGALGRVEDEIDGIVCAHLAWLWAQRSDALVVYGDVATGYVVAPPRPTWEPTPRLRPATPAEVEVSTLPVAPPSAQAPSEQRSAARCTTPDANPLWARLDALAAALPAGSWTTYSDLATVLGTHARPLSERVRATHPPAYWRILSANGSVSPGFRWDDGRSDAERSVLQHLHDAEGVTIERGRAASSARLSLAALRRLAKEHP